jgi:hypothetical protein
MKQIFLSTLFLLFTLATALAQETRVRPTLDQITGEEVAQRQSPMTSSWFVNGGKYVRVVYNQPSLRGRNMLGSEAVPFGKLWRFAANEATEIFFNKPIKVNGKKLKAGAYTLYAIPNADNWTILFNSANGMIGTTGYDEKKNVLTVTVPVKEAPKKFETFFIWFDTDGKGMNVAWDKTWVTVPMEIM